MKGMITVEYPEYLANTLRLSGKDFEWEIKINSLVKLFELGKVSSGVAAQVLGLSRIDFLELLSRYNVSAIGEYDLSDLHEDIANA